MTHASKLKTHNPAKNGVVFFMNYFYAKQKHRERCFEELDDSL